MENEYFHIERVLFGFLFRKAHYTIFSKTIVMNHPWEQNKYVSVNESPDSPGFLFLFYHGSQIFSKTGGLNKCDKTVQLSRLNCVEQHGDRFTYCLLLWKSIFTKFFFHDFFEFFFICLKFVISKNNNLHYQFVILTLVICLTRT